MSAVCLKLITFLCLCCTALSGSESNKVVRRDAGGYVTIECRFSESSSASLTWSPVSLTVTKGLKNANVLFKRKGLEKTVIAKDFKSRLQMNGDFPDLDILIKNLTSDDMGPYWCKYQKSESETVTGEGSVLLLVNEYTETAKKCDQSNKSLVMVSVVISAAVLIGIILAFLVWIVKTRSRRTTEKPGRINNNDVYEDMRGTIRR